MPGGSARLCAEIMLRVMTHRHATKQNLRTQV
jgi:hypothetical protein